MKKTLLILGLFTSLFASAQDCSELFISEYLEGYSNNKALEIYNPTNNWVDLSQYFVVRYNNGNSSATIQNAIQLRGMLAPHDVQVGVLDKRDSSGTGQEAPVWEDLQAKADQYYCPDYNTSNTFYWNGNDAVVLFKGTIDPTLPLSFSISDLTNVQPLDIFGKIGEDPGEGWTYDGSPVANGGIVVTKDHFLVRKANVKKGVATPVSTFKPNIEWDTLSFFTFKLDQNGDTIRNNQGAPAKFMNVDNLGKHTCDCGNATAVSEASKNEVFDFKIFPNPIENKTLNIITTDQIKQISVYNSLGQKIKDIPNAKPYMSIQLEVNQGVYFVTGMSPSGIKVTKKFIVR